MPRSAIPFDFGRGFRAGYQSVCMGGDGCRPPMPPRNYWSCHYQCDEGRCQVMAWYDGYHHGALAAQCNGCEGQYNVMCASDHLRREALLLGLQRHRTSGRARKRDARLRSDGLHYDMPLETPPAPAAADYGVPMAPQGVSGVGGAVGPTEVARPLRNHRSRDRCHRCPFVLTFAIVSTPNRTALPLRLEKTIVTRPEPNVMT